jgi:EmrB/QacA subfamily drug resistance transporter
MLAVVLGSGIVFLDSTIVNVALPKIGQELPSSVFGVLEAQSYVYNGYLLTLSALLILAGALNDYYGRRRMFALGLVGFGATSLLCGLAPNMELLIIFRLLQGASGAMLVPGSLAIITATFDGEAQGRAFGIWAGASGATTILGPFVGGLLVDSISWRMAFLINVPLVVLGYYATARHVTESRDEEASAHFEWVGAGVVALAVGGLAFGAIRGQQEEWRQPLAFVALGVGGLATISFPFLMARSRHPLVPLHLFRSRNFTVTNISTFLIYGALYVTGYFSAIFAQGTLGYTAAAAGFSFIPASLLLTLFSSRFGSLAARYGPRLFMSVGPAIMGLGILWLARIPPNSSPWDLRAGDPSTWLPPGSYGVDLLPAFLVFGVGLTIMVAPLTTALMTSVPKRNSGVASAVNNAISRVGPQLAGAAIFVAIAASFYSGLADRVPDIDVSSPAVREEIAPLNRPPDDFGPAVERASRGASTDSFHLAMAIAAGLLFAGAAVNAVGIRNRLQPPKAADLGQPEGEEENRDHVPVPASAQGPASIAGPGPRPPDEPEPAPTADR